MGIGSSQKYLIRTFGAVPGGGLNFVSDEDNKYDKSDLIFDYSEKLIKMDDLNDKEINE